MKKFITVIIAIMFIAGSVYAAKVKKPAPAPTPTVEMPTPVPTATMTVMGKIKFKIKGLFGGKAVVAPAVVSTTADAAGTTPAAAK